MSEKQTQRSDSTQKQQPYQETNIYSAETEKLYLKMKEGWL